MSTVDVSKFGASPANTDNSSEFIAAFASGADVVNVSVDGVYLFSTYGLSPLANQSLQLSPRAILKPNSTAANANVVFLANPGSSIVGGIVDGNVANCPNMAGINVGAVAGCRIDGVTIQNTGIYGIGQIQNAAFLTIRRNKIINSSWVGIFFKNTIATDVEGLIVEDNLIDLSMVPTIALCQGGMSFQQTWTGGQLRSLIRGNAVKMPFSPTGVASWIGIEHWLGNECLIKDNHVIGGNCGISAMQCNNSIVADNIIEGPLNYGIEYGTSLRTVIKDNITRGMGITRYGGTAHTGNTVSYDNVVEGNIYVPGS